MSSNSKTIIGSCEWVTIPDLDIPKINARIDSGARISSIHAYNISTFKKNSITYVDFDLFPVQNNRKICIHKTCKVYKRRNIKSSNGISERRYTILVNVEICNEIFPIELSLSNRDEMGFRMLIGREALKHRFLVDPAEKYIFGNFIDNISDSYSSIRIPKKKLTIGLLATNPDLYSNRRIMQAGIEMGHDMQFLNIKHCYLKLDTKKPEIRYRGGQILNNVDAIIPRIRPSKTKYGCSIIRQFESLNKYSLNSSDSIINSRDKLLSLQMLVAKGIPIPTTGFADSPQDTTDLIEMVGGAPLIGKLLESTQGTGVVKAENQKIAESIINAFKSLKTNIIVQECIKESIGRDLRVIVINGKVIASMERIAPKGEFRANLHKGGKGIEVKLSKDEKKVAIKSAKVLGLDVAGVDILRGKDGPVVIEVNSSPGLQGIENITNIDIAEQLITTIEKKLSRK